MVEVGWYGLRRGDRGVIGADVIVVIVVVMGDWC